MFGFDRDWELKLGSGRRVVWQGKSGIDAANRYVDAHRAESVVAWRSYPRHGVVVGLGASDGR